MDERTVRVTVPAIAKRFQEHIRVHTYDFREDDISSVIDMLYMMYVEAQSRDPESITEGFAALERYMAGISLEDNNNIFSLVCQLCNLYEERAFKDALQLGANLILELQGE